MSVTDGIVTRLRVLNHHAKKLAENESLHDLHREAFTRCENLTWQAAAEIERLRAELNEARQKLLQHLHPDIKKAIDAAKQCDCSNGESCH